MIVIIEELIETLNLMIESGQCKASDNVFFKYKDSSGKFEHSVDYILYGTINDGKISLQEDWL